MNNRTCKLISLNAKYHLHVQHSTNAHNKYASRNKILLGTRVRVLEVMHDKITSTTQQGIGTNHKAYKCMKTTLKAYKSNMSTNKTT